MTPRQATRSPERRVAGGRPVVLLALGALGGLAAAAAGLLGGSDADRALPEGAVAAVNGTPVRLADYERALSAVASDLRGPIDEAKKRHVLDRLIEEELLVQRALELGLATRDRRVRTDLVAAMIDAVTADAGQREPTADELEAFFEQNRDYFARPGRLRAERVFVRGDGEVAAARAREIAARLHGGESAAALGDPPVAPLPDALLPPAKLREYLGPAAVEALAALEPGGVAEPVATAGGWAVLRLAEREPPQLPALAALEPEVRAEWRRRAGDEALRSYLEELRRRAAVELAGSLP